MTSWVRLWVCLSLLLLPLGNVTHAQSSDRTPVAEVAAGRLSVTGADGAGTGKGAAGTGMVPVALSGDWQHPMHLITRAVVMLHGTMRNADTYLHLTEQARRRAGVPADTTLLIAPQFLTPEDIAAHPEAAQLLHWSSHGWKQGDASLGTAELSSFAVLDSLLARLADRTMFPALTQVVLAGHSAGAQMLQRYAVVGHDARGLIERGITLRYVVANPSSYLWFGEDRPVAFDRQACPGFDRWKYGVKDPPAYVQMSDGLERRYIARDVVYLLGEADTDPEQRFLDRSCAAMAQGRTRLERGMWYMFSLEVRNPNLVRNRIVTVPGVGHNAPHMFASVCGMAALFGTGNCPGLRN